MEDALENRAVLADNKIYDHTDCGECEERYIFTLKDSTHEFSVGLTTVLACLAFAEHEGAVPPIPGEWWKQINYVY